MNQKLSFMKRTWIFQPKNRFGYSLTFVFLALALHWKSVNAQSVSNCEDITNPAVGAGELRDAVIYLCENDAIIKETDKHPDDFIIRNDLASMVYKGRWHDPNLSKSWVKDLPIPFADLQDDNIPAKALSYYEGRNGISPFTREFGVFKPHDFIKRKHTLKVLLESYDVSVKSLEDTQTDIQAHLDAGNEWYKDYLDFKDDAMLPYIWKASQLEITKYDSATNPNFRPNANTTRGEAFLMYYRLLMSGRNGSSEISIPANFDEADDKNGFYIPSILDVSLAAISRGFTEGNFRHTTTNGLAIAGTPSMSFIGHYQAFNVTQNLHPIKSMGEGWNHPWNLALTDLEASDRAIIHHYDGRMSVFEKDNRTGLYLPISEFVFSKLGKISTDNYRLISRNGAYVQFSRLKPDDEVAVATEIVDRYGNAVYFEYEDDNYQRLIKIHDGRGRGFDIEYSTYIWQKHLIKKVTDHTGRSIEFFYGEFLNRLTGFKDARGNLTKYSYRYETESLGRDAKNVDSYLLSKIEKPEGTIINAKYNEHRRLYDMSINTGYHISVDYGNDHIYNTTDPDTYLESTVTSYNPDGTESMKTEYTMTKKGQVRKVMTKADFFAMGVDFGVERDFNDPDNPLLPTSEKVGDIEVKRTYDDFGQVTKLERIAGSQTITETYVYNSFGDLTQYTNPLGNTTKFIRSGSFEQFLDKIIPPIESTAVTMQYAMNGNLTKVTNPEGISQSMTYDEFGVLKSTTNNALGLTTQIRSDVLGRPIQVTDGNGNWQKYQYDPNSNITHLTRNDGERDIILERVFDKNDRLTKIINPLGKSTTLAYDDFERLKSESFLNSTRKHEYYEDGRYKKTIAPNGEELFYQYDKYLRLTSNGYADFQYYNDKIENAFDVKKVIKDGKALSFEYDDFKRVTKITYNGKSVEYRYDDANQVTGIRYPNGKWVNYTFDANGRLVEVKDWNNKTTSIEWRNDGMIKKITLPNAVIRTYDYDDAGRLIALKDIGTNGIICAYTVNEQDKTGNHKDVKVEQPLTIPKNHYVSGKTFFGYAEDNTLTSMRNKSGDFLHKFEYDGNRRQKSINDIQNASLTTLAYDKRNHLTSYESPTFTATYQMDGNGQRRFATRNGVTTEYVLSGMSVIAEYEAGLQHFYIHGIGMLYRIDEAGNYRYFHYDPRGSTVAMTDDSQNITHKYVYDAWGKVIDSEEEDLNRYRYVGQWGIQWENDDLYFMRARYYSPLQKRFLSEDPIWHSNLFPYANNNPVMMIDSDGQFAVPAIVAVAAAGAIFGGISQVAYNIMTNQPIHQGVLGAVVGGGVGAVSSLVLTPLGGIALGSITETAVNHVQYGYDYNITDYASNAMYDVALGKIGGDIVSSIFPRARLRPGRKPLNDTPLKNNMRNEAYAISQKIDGGNYLGEMFFQNTPANFAKDNYNLNNYFSGESSNYSCDPTMQCCENQHIISPLFMGPVQPQYGAGFNLSFP